MIKTKSIFKNLDKVHNNTKPYKKKDLIKDIKKEPAEEK